jgi:SAM-dependent methyltransferase
VVLRLALHHFEHVDAGLAEIRRLLRPGGRVVVLDILTVPDPETAALHNAIEILRDPSHVRFVPLAALGDSLRAAGLTVVREESWAAERSFREWARIINEPTRMAALEVVMRRLARAGVGAGIDLREHDGELRFDYRFGLLVAEV